MLAPVLAAAAGQPAAGAGNALDDHEPQGSLLLALPLGLLSRVVLEAATRQGAVPAQPLCRGELEAEACGAEVARDLEPFVAPERVVALRLVCRAFRRILDDEFVWRRVALETRRPPAAQIPTPESMTFSYPRQCYFLADAVSFFQRLGPVRALHMRVPLAVSASTRVDVAAARLWALASFDEPRPLAASLEELDVRLSGLFHAHSIEIGVPNPLSPPLSSLRSLRISFAVEWDGTPFTSAQALLSVHQLWAGFACRAPQLTELDVTSTYPTEASLRELACAPSLTALSLSSSPLTVDDDSVLGLLRALARFKRLQRLCLRFGPADHEGTELDAAGLHPLTSLTDLQSLHLVRPVASLDFLSPLSGLRHLSLAVASARDLRPLASLAARLRSLDLSFPFEGDASRDQPSGPLFELVPLFTRLEALRLHAPVRLLEGLAAAPLAPLSRLRILALSWDPPPALVSRVASDLSGLRELVLCGDIALPLPAADAAALRRRLRRLRVVPPGTGPMPPPAAQEALRRSLAGVQVAFGAQARGGALLP